MFSSHKITVEFFPNIYRPQTKFAKVMFLQVSVCPHGGGMCGCSGGGMHGCCWGGMCGCCRGGLRGCCRGGHAWLLLGGHAWLLLGCMGYDEIWRYDQWAGGMHPTGMHSFPLNSLTTSNASSELCQALTCGFAVTRILHAPWLSSLLLQHVVLLQLEILHSHCFCCHVVLLWLEIPHFHWLIGFLLQKVAALLLSGDWILHSDCLSDLLQESPFFKFPQ